MVDNLFVLAVNIRNNGTLSIKKDEIIEPIKISYKEKFIECTMTGTNPEGIGVYLDITNDENSVDCKFNLLNPRDYFTLQFVSLQQLSNPTITSRIYGLSKIRITSIFDQGFFDNLRSNIEGSTDYPFKHGLNDLLNVFEDKFSKPLYYFTLPGFVLATTAFLMGLSMLHDYSLGGSLRFGPVLLMIIMTIIGGFMCFAGIMVQSMSKSMSNLIKHID